MLQGKPHLDLMQRWRSAALKLQGPASCGATVLLEVEQDQRYRSSDPALVLPAGMLDNLACLEFAVGNSNSSSNYRGPVLRAKLRQLGGLDGLAARYESAVAAKLAEACQELQV